MDERPIGMFDSGVGGLTVLREVINQNPGENIVYLGDTKRFPYGSKSKETIIELTKKGIDFLVEKGVKAVIIACGTATSQALDELKGDYEIPIMGIIDATVQYIKQNQNKKEVGIMATTGTIRSKGWENHLKKEIPTIQIQSQACPLLAPMAEEGWITNEIAKLVVHEYVQAFHGIDTLILGCTHYPLFKPLLQKELGKGVEIINTGEILSIELKEFLKQKAMNNDKGNQRKIYLTDTQTNFVKVANLLLDSKKEMLEIEKVDIEV
ncbi:MAG: glutamate racemase [Clostridia bacterium]